MDRIYRPFDNLTISAILNNDGTTDKKVLAPFGEVVKADFTNAAEWKRLMEIFTAPSLQMVSFTITEKGSSLTGLDGNYTKAAQRDIELGPAKATGVIAIGEDIKRLRHQICRKFQRASLNAKNIYEICKQVGDTQTQLEAEAYYDYIYSNFLIFKSKFSEALNLLIKASSIYAKISELKDSFESITYKDKITNINTSIRLCKYNLSTSKDIIFDEEEFMKNVNVEDIELSKQFEEIKKKNIESNASKPDQYEIKYHGMNIPIKNEKLKDMFIKLEELSKKIEKEENLTKKIALFQDYYNKIDEMVKIVKKEKSEETTQQAENFSKIYGKILSYIEHLRLRKYIEKNLSFIKDYTKDFENLDMITLLFDKENLKLRVKPQEIIKLFDNLLEYQGQLISLEKENPDQTYLIDLNYKEKVYNLFKVFYAGLFYVLNKKFLDSYIVEGFDMFLRWMTAFISCQVETHYASIREGHSQFRHFQGY